MSSGIKVSMGGVGTVTPPQPHQATAEEAPANEPDTPQTPHPPQ